MRFWSTKSDLFSLGSLRERELSVCLFVCVFSSVCLFVCLFKCVLEKQVESGMRPNVK
jgi:hypothetical protein